MKDENNIHNRSTQEKISRRSFLKLVAAVGVLAACSPSQPQTWPANLVSSASEPTATIEATPPASAPSPADFEANCRKTDCYQGLNSIWRDFNLDHYKCIYVSERVVLWLLKLEDPKRYLPEAPKIEQAIPILEKYLSAPIADTYHGEKQVSFFYGEAPIAWTPGQQYKKPVIFMPFWSDSYSFHAYMHELTHAFGYASGNGWASEGLAVYLNDYLGGEGCFPNFGTDIDSAARNFAYSADIVQKVGDAIYYPTADDIQFGIGKGFYSLSGSFVKYLIEKIGIETFLKVYHSVDLQGAMQKLTGKSVQEWKDEWFADLPSLGN